MDGGPRGRPSGKPISVSSESDNVRFIGAGGLKGPDGDSIPKFCMT